MTVKTILACRSLLDEQGNRDAYVTAVIRDRDVVHPAGIAGGDSAEILNFQKTVARLMVQSGRHPGMSDLLSDGGSSIYMKPITRYVHVDHAVDYYTLGASAARYGEIAIGYKRFNDDGSFDIVVNPKSKAAITFGAGDDLIVVAPE